MEIVKEVVAETLHLQFKFFFDFSGDVEVWQMDGTISRRFQRREQKSSVFSSNESFVVSNLEFQELSANLEIVLSYLFLF